MATSKITGRTRFGLALAFATAALWATLPVVLKVVLRTMDPYTLTWFRFFVAFALFVTWVGLKEDRARWRALTRREWGVLALAAVGLVGNYVAYIVGLHDTTPANSQLVIQLAPLAMAVGGMVLFSERFTVAQWAGSAVLLTGLGLFFRDQLLQVSADPARYLGGSAMIVIAALAWAIYALCQKQLLTRLSSAGVLTVVFGLGTVVLLPIADFSAFAHLDGWGWLALGYGALNTIAAYVCFAESLAHIEASRVSAVLALNPLLTLGVVAVTHLMWPEAVEAAGVAALGLFGAVVVVVGSTVTSFSGGAASSRTASTPAK